MFIDHREEILKSKIQLLQELITHVETKEQAKNLYSGLFKDCLDLSAEIGNLDQWIYLEEIGYKYLIKKFEYEEHYNSCLSILDQMADQMANTLRKLYPTYFIDKNINQKKKIIFLIHDLNSHAAHIEVFYNFIKSLDKDFIKEKNITIEVIGFFNPTISLSYFLKELKELNYITIHKFPNEDSGAKTPVKVFNYLNTENYVNCIFLSVPIFVSLVSKLFKNISLWGHRFNIKKSFKDLKNFYYLVSEDNLGLNREEIEKLRENKKKIFEVSKIIFFSINRLQKMEKILFLNSIKEILLNIPNSEFHYASNAKSEMMQSFFFANKLDKRVKVLGFVDTKNRLDYGDIYLDTPELSGTIAAKCFAIGIPVVWFRNSLFWGEKNLKDSSDDEKFNLISYFQEDVVANDVSYYINFATEISKNHILREKYINICIKIANKNFYNQDNVKKFFNNLINESN